MASRFKDLNVSVEDFISEQENESTKNKTLQNVAVSHPRPSVGFVLSYVTKISEGQTFLPFFLFSFQLLRICYKRFRLYIFFICNCRKKYI